MIWSYDYAELCFPCFACFMELAWCWLTVIHHSSFYKNKSHVLPVLYNWIVIYNRILSVQCQCEHLHLLIFPLLLSIFLSHQIIYLSLSQSCCLTHDCSLDDVIVQRLRDEGGSSILPSDILRTSVQDLVTSRMQRRHLGRTYSDLQDYSHIIPHRQNLVAKT